MEKLIFPCVRESYADLMQASEGADLLVTHPITFAGPLVARTTGIPWISTVLAPLSFFSAYDPPMPPFWPWMNKFRLLGPRFMRSFMDLLKRNYRAKLVEEFRVELGIRDYGNPAFDGQHSPALVLALFSKHFAVPQPDWPRHAQITGFPFYDGRHEKAMPPELLEFLDSGAAPIVFTLGSSAVWVARDFFQESIAATKKLGRRAVLLIGDERNHPQEPLPPEMIAIDYAPFESMLERACVVVHHGGVGTTSQGLLAGIPTLIVPFAFDQSDNAAHAARLGTSRTLYRRSYKAERVARELDNLLGRPQYALKAGEVGACLRSENGAATASNLIEEFLNGFQRQETANEYLAYASRN